MEGHGPALPLMRHLHLQAEHVAQLALERGKVGVRPWLGQHEFLRAGFCPLGPLLGLTNREALGDNFLRKSDWVRSRGNRPGMTHADIALQ